MNVYRVPMRNWNLWKIKLVMVYEVRLSRAYEELKQSTGFWSESIISKFIACLWGIETYIVWPSNIFGAIPVYRVPMRNWNILLNYIYYNSSFTVYRVPMRNWNNSFTWGGTLGNCVYRVPMRNWNMNEITLKTS